MANLAVGLARDHSEPHGGPQGALLAHKAELLGELAGAIAHRFNNIMMAVSSYAEVELKKATPQQKRSLEQVLSNVGQATFLVQKLLTFSRRHSPSVQPISLGSVVTGMSGFLQQLAGDGVEVALNLSHNAKAINADPVEIEYLILSLAINTRSGKANGKLMISTAPIELDKSFIEPGEDAAPGQYVMVSVSGTEPATTQQLGSGDSQKHQEPGGPTQAALEAARVIVKQAGGLIRISSSAQNSPNCRVYFPALGQATPEEAAAGILPKNLAIARTILVVEDDDAVRVPATEFLKMEGFKVLQAKTGIEALQIVERHHSVLDLLVTDIIMPEMSGREVAEKLQEIYPDLKVLYMSGDPENTPAFKSKNLAQTVLQKPFRLNKLNEKIHDLLGQ